MRGMGRQKWLVAALALLTGCGPTKDMLGPSGGNRAPGISIEIVGGFSGGGLIERFRDSTTGVVCYGRYDTFSCVRMP